MSEFQKIKNPYVVGNPIKSADMFFGREKDFQIIHDWIVTDAPHVIVLIAGRRSGKTSLLIQIKGGRLKNIGEAVFVDFHSIVPRIQNDEDFPLEIGKAILQNPIFKSFAEDFFKRDGQSWTLQLQILIERCMDKIKPRKLLVLCDEFESIEELFKSGLLSAKSLLWTRQVLNQSVYFIMTGSHEFEDNTIKTVFDVVSQKKPMYELDERDAIALIEEPVKGRLNYAAGVPHQIMRLAGAQPFYVQYVCQTLVNQINADFKRNEVLPGDLDETVKFIVKQPCGHMQESWRDPVGRKIKGNEKNRLINQIRHLLGALANSIKDSEKYVDIEAILLTAEQKHFAVSEKNIYKTLAWLKQNSRLLEWEEAAEKYRFRIELFRHWVLYTVQRGEDIVDEPVGSGSEDLPESTPMPNAQGEEYATQVQTYLADDLISLNERQHLDQLIGRLNLRQEQAERLEAAARAKQQQPPLDWLEEYKESCRVLKRQHSGKAPAASLQTLQSVYENNGRLPPQKAREIRQYIGLRGKRNKMLMWVGSVAGLAVAGLAVWWLLPANTAPNAGDDQLQTAHNAPLGFNAAGLLANDNDAEGDALRLVAVSDALHGKVHLENDQITFTPDTDFSGTAGFQYQISDERGAQTEAWVSIQVADAPAPVNPVNTAPNAGNDQLQTPYNTPLRISAAELLANDSDAEGDALRLVAV
ncbi:MAG: hypothetical protein GY862_32880, partial [Gammaproteobacteria bacterium]|nr:hypothetical protein [Gammaproteobacteria bacterium]